MKKFFAMLVAAAMVLSLVAVPAMAKTSSHDPKTGTAPRVSQTVPHDAATIDEALNVPGGTLVFTNDATYPWVIVGDAAQSGNGGVASSESSVSTTVTAVEGDIVQFDYKAWGEGSDSYDWDKCRFYIDSDVMMDYGAHQNDWETAAYELTAGDHTLTWTYKKDSSVNPTGDYFMVDNVYVGQPVMAEEINVQDVTVPAGRHINVVYEVLPAATFDKSVTFAIADTSIATVNANGVVTGVAEGTTTITVTSAAVPTVSGTATVTVTEALPTVNLFGYDTYDIAGNYDGQWVEFPDYDPAAYIAHGAMGDAWAAAFAGGTVYGYLYANEGADTRFFIMDAETFAVTYPGTDASNVSGILGMAYNHANNVMYGISGGDTRQLCTIDRATGVVTAIAPVSGMNTPLTFAISTEGVAYAIEYQTGDLYTINLDTAAATLVGSTGVGCAYVQSMCYDHDTNQIFWAQILDGSTHGLYVVDPETAQASYLGMIGPDGGEIVSLYTKNDIEVPAVEMPDITVTFVDGVDNAVISTLVCPAGTVLVDSDFPTPPEHEGLEFVAWNYDGSALYADTTITARYRDPNATTASITLRVPQDVWGDGSGYQMLLDADATAYGSIIPTSGGLTSGGDAPDSVYAEFEYKIPVNADGHMNTSNMISQGEITIEVPAGVYDWCITNPTPGDRIWIASSNGNIPGRYDDYEFEGGNTYIFTVTFGGTNDQVDLEIVSGTTPGETPEPTTPGPEPTPVPPTGEPQPGDIWDFETDPEAQGFQLLDQDGDGYNWEWHYGPDWADFNYHEGQGYMASNSYVNYVGPLTPDNWLITPEFSGTQLTFWAQGQDPSYAEEYIGAFVSTDGGATWSNEIAGWTLTGSDTQYTVDLSAYASVRTPIKVALRHYNVTDMFIANLDYIEVSGGSEEPTPVPPTDEPTPYIPVTPEPGEVAFVVEAPDMVAPGEDFEAVLNLVGDYGEAHVLNLQLNYDPAVLSIVGDPVRGDILNNADGMIVLDHTTIEGSIRLGVMCGTTGFSGEGTIFTVTFHVADDTTATSTAIEPVPTEFRYFPVDGSPVDIPCGAYPAVVNIGTEPEPTPVPPTDEPEPTPVPPTEAPEPNEEDTIFSIDDIYAMPGEDIELVLDMSGAQYTYTGLNLKVFYDSSVLTLTGVDNGTVMLAVAAAMGMNVLDTTTIPDCIAYAAIFASAGIDTQGDIFTMHFHVADDAVEGTVVPVEIVVEEYISMPDIEEIPLPHFDKNGSVTIGAEPVEPTPVPPTDEPVEPTPEPTTPPTPPTGTIALVGVGIAAIAAGAGVVLFRRKED